MPLCLDQLLRSFRLNRPSATAIAGLLVAATGLVAQGPPSQQTTGPSPATQLPLSPPQATSNAVSVTRGTTNLGDGNSVNVINSSVSVSGSYAGSASTTSPAPGILSLSLAQALAMGLRFNLGVADQNASVQQAAGERSVARSGLLPNLHMAVSEEFERLNLREMGVESETFPLTATFNYFDARAARLNQSVLDLVKVNNYRSSRENYAANIQAARNARDLVVLAVAGTYLQIVATRARIAAASSQVETSRAIYQQATDRFMAGLNARIDATRAQVELQTEQQRLRSLQADLDTQKLHLARMIGLPLEQAFAPADDYQFKPLAGITQAAALETALASRADLDAAATSVKAAQDALDAARAERLPNIAVIADFGAGGLRPDYRSSSVYTAAGTLTLPLFEGGRIHGDIQQAAAVLHERQAALADMRSQVDEDVRQAFIDLNAAADQVDVAASNVNLSHDTLTQSRDRFAAGIADSVELIQGEQSVVQAEEDYISAVFEHNLAKISLARAMGNAEKTLPQWMGQ